MLLINLAKGRAEAADQSTIDQLKKGHFGIEGNGKLLLAPEEALYLIEVRNAECMQNGKLVSFNLLASKYKNRNKFMARYFTFKDWRERGLVIWPYNYSFKAPNNTPVKKYPSSSFSLPRYKLTGTFYKPDLMAVLDDDEAGKELYEKYWFGQYGSYKAADRGHLNKLDIYEAFFLVEHGLLKLSNMSEAELKRYAVQRRKDFLELYEVYKDWREKGYVVKTGFKFGTHFRLYFPGAKPVSSGNWMHSKHVIHVFPKQSRLLISEWARAIRVAHSVRKTFILAIPGKAKASNVQIDFVLFHRHNGEADNPEETAPKYAMLSLGEEEYIGGNELAGAIKKAKEAKLELILAIADRETSVTYYKVRQIALQGSKHDYYEIEWMQP